MYIVLKKTLSNIITLCALMNHIKNSLLLTKQKFKIPLCESPDNKKRYFNYEQLKSKEFTSRQRQLHNQILSKIEQTAFEIEQEKRLSNA